MTHPHDITWHPMSPDSPIGVVSANLERLKKETQRMNGVQQQMLEQQSLMLKMQERNNELTEIMYPVITAFSGFVKVIRWLGRCLKWVASWAKPIGIIAAAVGAVVGVMKMIG